MTHLFCPLAHQYDHKWSGEQTRNFLLGLLQGQNHSHSPASLFFCIFWPVRAGMQWSQKMLSNRDKCTCVFHCTVNLLEWKLNLVKGLQPLFVVLKCLILNCLLKFDKNLIFRRQLEHSEKIRLLKFLKLGPKLKYTKF